MEEILGQVETLYSLKIKGVVPVRKIFKLITDKGTKGLKSSLFPLDRFNFMAQGIDYLHRQGFNATPSLYLSTQGLPYTQINGRLYYLVDWIQGGECDFSYSLHLRGSLETLAEFHHLSCGFQSSPQCRPKKSWGKWPRIFQRNLHKLAQYKRLVSGQKNKTAFDQLYAAWADYFINQGYRALEILNESQYCEICAEAKSSPALCHHDVSARNFVCTEKGKVFLIDLEFLRFDVRSYDLGKLIARTLFDLNSDFDHARAIIDYYNQANPLVPQEFPLLLALVNFPQKFYRLAEGYYRKIFPGSAEEALLQFEAIIKHEKRRARYLAEFASFCGIRTS